MGLGKISTAITALEWVLDNQKIYKIKIVSLSWLKPTLTYQEDPYVKPWKKYGGGNSSLYCYNAADRKKAVSPLAFIRFYNYGSLIIYYCLNSPEEDLHVMVYPNPIFYFPAITS